MFLPKPRWSERKLGLVMGYKVHRLALPFQI
ncbi:protein of unknown function (plasmid) [Azospirillum baldaniorum]|uniref:Uncharacterized protein n=1 Tax=Azospirillum baldaniorum TaxID=1064539 RepID=A0A9P1JY34_9PROT|nr:protein of unknown function [Azospirillum baldaniorum]